MLSIDIQGEDIVLLADKALWWPRLKTIIVSDLHWGKSAHFRKNGIAIPNNTQNKDELRLASIIIKHKAERLIIAGDLFHSRSNKEVERFANWRLQLSSLQIQLVSGNHDILEEEKYKQWNIDICPASYYLSPFHISHDIIPDFDEFVIHGHVHPAVRLTNKGQQSLKLSCFVIDHNRLILPAFGQFTGTHVLDSNKHNQIYVIAENKVIRWK